MSPGAVIAVGWAGVVGSLIVYGLACDVREWWQARRVARMTAANRANVERRMARSSV